MRAREEMRELCANEAAAWVCTSDQECNEDHVGCTWLLSAAKRIRNLPVE
jgi:hypothetical protein